MSHQLSLSAAFSALAMTLFALTAQAGLPVNANSAPVDTGAPLVIPFEVSR